MISNFHNQKPHRGIEQIERLFSYHVCNFPFFLFPIFLASATTADNEDEGDEPEPPEPFEYTED